MKQIILFAVFCLGGIFASADEQTIPAPEPQYTILKSRGSSCLRNDFGCRENLRNMAISDAQVASVNYCKVNFSKKTKVINWKADCNALFVREIHMQTYPQPPQPEYPQSVSCWATFDFVCVP